MDQGKFIVLVGPSGCGNTAIMNHLITTHDKYRIVPSMTTRKPREGEIEENYIFLEETEFAKLVESGALLEYSEYARHQYGTSRGEVECILQSGAVALKAMDIIGAMKAKEIYGKQCMTIFVKRPRIEVVRAILLRSTSEEDKTQRLALIEAAYLKDAPRCDFIVDNSGTIENAANKIIKLLQT